MRFLNCVVVGLLLALPAAGPDPPVVIYASLGHSVTLPCGGEPSRDVGWIFKQRGRSQWYLVAKLQAGALSPGRGFQGRVQSFHGEKPGNYSIAISPVVYTYLGIYQCQYTDGTFISDVTLDILVPSHVSVAMGMSVSLSCYASIGSGASAVDLDILWKKGEKLVYQHYNNIITYGPGFENRVSLSPELALLGNNSLTVNKTQFSDGGQYQCFFNTPKENGYPDSVSLTVTVPSHVSVAMGMSVSLPCYASIGGGASAVDLDILWKKGEKLVYQLYNNIITYGPGFENRVSLSPELALLGNNSLTVNKTQFSDEGEYQCFFNTPRENGYPDSVTLTVT
ncbi:hypothetical protein SKAU_G00345040, partial [Synaphobranchus kaupii]